MPSDDTRVRIAAAAIDTNSSAAGAASGAPAAASGDTVKRGRKETEPDRHDDDKTKDPGMVCDVACNTFVKKEALPEDRPATKSHVMALLAQLQQDMQGTMEKATHAAADASNKTLQS